MIRELLYVCLNYIPALCLYLAKIVFEFEYQSKGLSTFIVSSIYVTLIDILKKRGQESKQMLCLRSTVTTFVVWTIICLGC